jgi:Glutaminase
MLPQTIGRKFLAKAILPAFSFMLLILLAWDSKQHQTDTALATGTTIQSFSDTSIVTVGALTPAAEGRTIEVLFNELEQVFTFSKEDKSFTEFNRSFEAALKNKTPVKIITDPGKSSFTAVMSLSEKEMELFRRLQKNRLTGEMARKIDVYKIDTSTFNIVDEFLKWPAFRLCEKIVPDYATAKQIFDYCAAQCCCIVGPHQVNPCIPFQYVKDGCFARAHKMRWIIEKHFGYCSEKVFSFATVDNHKLVVKADKWGGCCVEWWYHVTPVIRVKSRLGIFSKSLAYVIDPGMFDKPVLLSTWLQAQENIACNANAHVDTYSIQPSSAYTPTYPTGTPYATDPNYALTDARLMQYAGNITCTN